MSFNDDEQVVETVEYLPTGIVNKAGKTQLTIFNHPEAPLEKSRWKVLLELRESEDHNKDRPGVDLVTVIDVSESMAGEKLDKLKNAMQFLIKKLSPIDRLSVVTFSGDSKRLFPLRQITESSQADIENQVNALVATGINTNIASGLETGLKVLNDRHFKEGRVGAIMLLSDGGQTIGDATKVQVGNVQVHTFGFGAEHELKQWSNNLSITLSQSFVVQDRKLTVTQQVLTPKIKNVSAIDYPQFKNDEYSVGDLYDKEVLKTIAETSIGGTFSYVQNKNNLSIAFSKCLPGLLAVVQDLRLTIAHVNKESVIWHVSAGNYPQSRNEDDSVTVFLGDLYNKEVHKVKAELLLHETDSPKSTEVLKVTYSHSGNVGKLYRAPPIKAYVKRVTDWKSGSTTAKMNKEAKVVDDDKKAEVVEAKNSLATVDIDEPNYPFFEAVKQQLYKRFTDVQFGSSRFLGMRTQDMKYKKQGRSFVGMSSFETCHDRHLSLRVWNHPSGKPKQFIRIPTSLSLRSRKSLVTRTPLLAILNACIH